MEKIFDDHLIFSPGDKFGTRYRIVEEIGRGGMGRIYKAKDQELDITVALKMIRPAYSSNPRFIQRFKEETLLSRSISHENVIRIYDIGDVDDIKFISMDYVKGHDLKELINTSGTLSVQTAISIARQICEGLKAAHQKHIIHLDLKPRNIMIDSKGKVLIMDFGVARSLEAHDSVQEKILIGTPAYVSPEQAKGEEVDQRSDIYSLGIIMFEMLTGRRPFDTDNLDDMVDMHIHKDAPRPSELMPHIPPLLDDIVLRCLKKDKNKRYQNVEELRKDLEECFEETQAYKIQTEKKKKWRFAYLLPVILILLVGVSTFLVKKRPIFSAATESGKIPLVVMLFENHTGDDDLDAWRMSLPYLIISDLQQSNLIKVLSSDSLYSILESLDIVDEKNYSSEDLKRVTDRGGSNYILYGLYARADDVYRIEVKLKDFRTSEIVPKRFQGQGDSTFFNTADEITLWVKEQLHIGNAEIVADSDQDIQDILTDSPEALNYYIEGKQRYYLGNFQESNRLLQKAVEIDKEFAMALRQISENYHYLGRIDRAKQYARSALSLKEKVSLRDRYLLEGWASTILEESYQNAEKIYLEMLQNYPDDEDANIYLGAIYRNQEEWALAQERFEKILNTNPILAIENIVHALKAQGRYKESLEFILANAENFHTAAYYHLDLGNIYFYQKKYDRALSELSNALSVDPDLPEGKEMFGHFYLIQNDFDRAENYFRAMIGSESPNTQFYGRLWLFGLRIAQGRYRECKKSISTAINEAESDHRNSDKLSYLNILAYVNLRMGHFEKAVETSLQAEALASELKFHYEKLIALRLKGISYLGLNKFQDAERTANFLQDYIENIKIPKFKRYYLHLRGMIALHAKQYSAAEENISEAISLLSSQHEALDGHAFFLFSLAQAYIEANQTERALEQFEKITQLTSGRALLGDIYAESYYWLGKIYQLQNQKQKALENFSKFLLLWEKADPTIQKIEETKESIRNLEGKTAQNSLT
jgi:serine/threonine protein kinase/Tfp pilus assembly protein PilF